MAKTKKSDDNLAIKIEDAVAETVKKAVHSVEEAIEPAVEKVEKVVKKIVDKIEDALEGDDKPKKKKAKEEKEEQAHKEHKEKPASDKIEELKRRLKEKAKALEGKVETAKEINIKEQVKGDKEEKKDTLVPMEDYLKSSIHLGTRVITPDMRKYVYRRRADGLAVFNTALLDQKLRDAAEYLAQFAPEDFIIVCKREAGWKAVELFAKTIGVKMFTKKYPAGVLTNTNLENFFETDMVFICDPWLDKNALDDANKIKLKVISISDTNNFTKGIDCIIPGNNKSWKSLGMIFYLLTKLYVEKRKMSVDVPPVEQFIEGWDTLQPPA